MKTTFILTALALLGLSACNNNLNFGGRSVRMGSDELAEHLGYVTYQGSRAADGCEWVVAVEDVEYHLDTENPLWLEDSQYIVADFAITSEEFQCGLNPDNSLQYLRIKKEDEASEYTTLYYAETQCANPWDAGRADAAAAVLNYLLEQEVFPYTLAIRERDDLEGVCQACECSSGRYFSLHVHPDDVATLLDLGFVTEQPGS